MNLFVYALNYIILCSFFLDLRCKKAERRFSLGLIRVLIFFPLLTAQYFYSGLNMLSELVVPMLFSELVFAVIWIKMAYNLPGAVDPAKQKASAIYFPALTIAVCCLFYISIHWLFYHPSCMITGYELTLPYRGQLYFSSLLLLVSVLVMAWRMEVFWRRLPPKDRWLYKYLVIGFLLICGSLGWSASYRIAYLRIKEDHLLLLSFFVITAWFLIAYATVHNRLLNRKIFVSRKVVYSTIAPISFACYLIILGMISLLMRIFGWPMHFVLQWLLIIGGLLLVSVLAFSQKVRLRVKYFISTHFYVNKYEYRDEWLAFSGLLQNKLTESSVVEALRQILKDTLYTDVIKIWVGNVREGFSLIEPSGEQHKAMAFNVSSDDPLIDYLRNHPYLYRFSPVPGNEEKHIISEKKAFFISLQLELLVPLAIGDHLVGIIGLGPEYTGGQYGPDDFDLLAALGSQAASALLAVRTAEELAKEREQNAWNVLSAFILHDVKNAANILSLVKENAAEHIQDPEFQQDMLVSVEDALKRMTKVQARLKTLKGEMMPVRKAVDAVQLLKSCCGDLAKKLPELQIDIQSRFESFQTSTDPEFFYSILENLLINSKEAGGGGTRVQVRIVESTVGELRMEVTDNGPGIPLELLPDRLFEPFKTSKVKGSGIGLWQVRQLVESLGGTIEAQNVEGQGAQFVIRLPSVYAP